MLASVLLAVVTAMPWEPIEVQYDLSESTEDETLAITTFKWSYRGEHWTVLLPGASANSGPCIEVVGPGGPSAALCDGLVLYDPNPVLATNGGKWDQVYSTGLRPCNVHHLLEVWHNERWQVFRLLWPIGGASGPPPVPLVTIAQDRASGRWAALATAFEHRVPDGGDTHGIEVRDDGGLAAWCWWWRSGSVLARRSWLASDSPGRVEWHTGPTVYMLQTYNGIPATYATDPRDAVHWGYQEVAWHVREAGPSGGVVEAFANSPRRVLGDEDLEDGLVIPEQGRTLSFVWPPQVYVVPYRTKGRWLAAADATGLAQREGYDAVLFRRRSGRSVAERLVQHQKDFLHSTPVR